MKDDIIQVRIDKASKKDLKRLSEAKKKSNSEIIRNLITLAIEQPQIIETKTANDG